MSDPERLELALVERYERAITRNAHFRASLMKFARDPHAPTTKPCQTCADISGLLEEKFHCAKRNGYVPPFNEPRY